MEVLFKIKSPNNCFNLTLLLSHFLLVVASLLGKKCANYASQVKQMLD